MSESTKAAAAFASPALGLTMPARRLAVFAVAALLIALASVLAGLQTPRVGLAVNRDGSGEQVRLTGPDTVVARDARLTFTAPGATPITFAAETIADDADPRIGHAANIDHWRRLSALARMIGNGEATLRFTDAAGRSRVYAIPAAPRTVGSLAPHYWSAWATAMIALIAGLWVWTIRHRDWASRQFALMSIGIFVAAIPIAISGETALATPHYRWVLAANSTGSMLFGAGLLGMLARFPVALVPPRLVYLSLGACLAVAAAQALELVAEGYQLIGIACMAIFAAMLALLAAQLIAARRDPVARRAATTIAVTTGTTMTIVVAITIVPIVLRIEQPLHTALVFPLLLIIHLGVAMAVTRAQLVSVGRWARAATATAGGVAALAAIDLIAIAIAWRVAGGGWALATAAAAAIHIGLRDTIRRRREAPERVRERDLLRRVTALTLAADPAERQTLWVQALRLAFAPLDVGSDAGDGDAPAIGANGLSLHIPATIETGALVLWHAEHGYRRFDATHLRRAVELCTLLESTTRARDAYLRGVTEERLRIARDLHDDVGARLMTSLHRGSQEVMRQDVRDAMADIRQIVGNLAGDRRALGEVLADLRHEAATRLSAAGIAVDWPLDAATAALPDLLDAAAARHLGSILRELTTNTIRHAGARQVRISVELCPAELCLRFADDGVGHVGEGEGNGLGNLVRRAQVLGGNVRFAGLPGFVAIVTVPRTSTSTLAAVSPDAGMAAVACPA